MPGNPVRPGTGAQRCGVPNRQDATGNYSGKAPGKADPESEYLSVPRHPSEPRAQVSKRQGQTCTSRMSPSALGSAPWPSGQSRHRPCPTDRDPIPTPRTGGPSASSVILRLGGRSVGDIFTVWGPLTRPRGGCVRFSTTLAGPLASWSRRGVRTGRSCIRVMTAGGPSSTRQAPPSKCRCPALRLSGVSRTPAHWSITSGVTYIPWWTRAWRPATSPAGPLLEVSPPRAPARSGPRTGPCVPNGDSRSRRTPTSSPARSPIDLW